VRPVVQRVQPCRRRGMRAPCGSRGPLQITRAERPCGSRSRPADHVGAQAALPVVADRRTRPLSPSGWPRRAAASVARGRIVGAACVAGVAGRIARDAEWWLGLETGGAECAVLSSGCGGCVCGTEWWSRELNGGREPGLFSSLNERDRVVCSRVRG
jgi:hypothetical protein